MDDCCAVCAEPLEWVAYGSCGHREVCSTCVVRLRFVLNDNRCCICKTESPSVFVTRAMGDYTRVISDFATLPPGAREGQSGSFWYHEESQAYFDDVDHYRMIKAMCKLSCSVCDKNSEDEAGEFVKRKHRFRSIEQLKGHLFHEHKLHMCNVCLKGRKVFISEQKLYTRPQLNQHIRTGDSEADGSESERGGFTGHPMCEFCRIPFYGDNELYMHNSTEHYTCHICRRQHPGQYDYDYFRNYDDLEIHFRKGHFLCEDEACLAKKFIVFASESEMKRHNAVEHGGNMSRSKRNAALQLPTSFRYESSQDNRRGRGRGRGFRPDPSNDHIARAIEAIQSNESSYTRDSSSSDPLLTELQEFNPSDPEPSSNSNSHILENSYFPPLSERDPPDPSSRYVPPFTQMSAAKLKEELFPPLPSTKVVEIPGNSSSSSSSTSSNTLASRLNKGKGKVKVINPPRPKESRSSNPDPSSFPQLKPVTQNQAPAAGNSMEVPGNSVTSSSSTTLASRLSKGKSAVVVNPPRPKDTRALSPNLTSFPELKSAVQTQVPTTSTSNVNRTSINNANRMSHSSSAPNLKATEDDRGTDKVLIEKILTALGNDEEKYAAFMSISNEYSSGQISVWEFLSYIEQFGLMNLVFFLGGLYPEKEKKFELFDAYNTVIRSRNSQVKDSVKHQKTKGKGKNGANSIVSSKDSMADKFVETVKELQLNQKQQENAEVEVLSRDGYRNSSSSKVDINASFGEESSRKGRKTSTFLKNRGLSADTSNIEDEVKNLSLERGEEEKNIGQGSGLVVKGAWKNNGGRKLI